MNCYKMCNVLGSLLSNKEHLKCSASLIVLERKFPKIRENNVG